ncbi:hypothetical protein Ddye_013086 [Dipteronia dyeriana]|uniref:HAT C-terminal dimerisation domain-containing protein n=1 Tax=Dipteronia dyeriana TaxID=168575 RepID=A0AAE0CJA9_9ROSI|nr:hypothetical protein Ddye_013086 [Dipteronia dyeriana]
MRFGQRSIEVYQNQSLLSGKRAIWNSGSSCLTLAAQHFDYEVSRIELSMMILMHDYPFKMVEHEGFRDYTRSLQPLFKPISRTTAIRDIMSMYEIERASLLTMLGKFPGRIAITSDMWTTGNQKRGYMTVTSHFIDSSWQLQSRLLRLSPSSLIMNGRLFHMRCAAHILNLIVKCGLDVIEFGIERIRDSVAFWMATQKEKTLHVSRELDVLSWWKLNGIKYPIMSEIARDILAIPISTVASESSFSTSGRIVSTQRNRLLPSTLEAIMCTQNWLSAGKKGNTIDGVGDIDVDDDNDNEVNEAADCSGATKA